jgi:hypothetical protein
MRDKETGETAKGQKGANDKETFSPFFHFAFCPCISILIAAETRGSL